MADREKDFSAGHHNGTLNPNYPHNNNASDSAHHNGTLNPNYPHHNGSEDSNRLGVGGYLHDDIPSDQALRRIKTAGSISISPELFEKIYLSPQNKVSGDLRKTFGNPTPIALVGFVSQSPSLVPLKLALADMHAAYFSNSAIMRPDGMEGSRGEWCCRYRLILLVRWTVDVYRYAPVILGELGETRASERMANQNSRRSTGMGSWQHLSLCCFYLLCKSLAARWSMYLTLLRAHSGSRSVRRTSPYG